MPNLTADHIGDFRLRVSRLAADTRPRWGRMTPALMVRHLRRAVEVSLGEVVVDDRSVPGVRTLAFVLLVRVFTIWPPSRVVLPPVWLPDADGFDFEKATLLQALDRFVGTLEREPTRATPHTIFGPLTLSAWSRLHGVHFNHHFRQFGLVRPREAPGYWRWLAIPVAGVATWLWRWW